MTSAIRILAIAIALTVVVLVGAGMVATRDPRVAPWFVALGYALAAEFFLLLIQILVLRADTRPRQKHQVK